MKPVMMNGATGRARRGPGMARAGSGPAILDADGTSAAVRLTVEVPGDPKAVRVAEPVTCGLPFPEGLCADERRIGVASHAGAVPVQARVLERWPDGSIRWALLDFQANAPASYDVRLGAVAPPAGAPLVIREHAGAADVDIGDLTFRISRSGSFRLDVGRRDADGAPGRSVGIDVTGQDGSVLRPDVTGLAWEATGSLHAVLRVDGIIGSERTGALRLIARLHFYAGHPTVRFDVTLWNPARAEHPGGLWELGDSGSVRIRDCSIRLDTGGSSSVSWSADHETALEPAGLPFELYQDSSGGENWQSPVHVNRDGVIPVSFRGYRVKGVPQRPAGLRATPVLWTDGPSGRTGVAMRHFWENAPKGLEADGRQIVLRLFPKQFADLHEMQGGEQKTHVFHVAFADDRVSALPLDWTRHPALATAPPAWYCRAGAVSYLTPVSDDPHPSYVELVNSVIHGPESFAGRRELIDEYGWRNFGDIYADHEAVFHQGPAPLVSHYNNQYDAIAGFACQFLRSADARWWSAMEELAWHVRDIDIYHTADDKAAYSGGLFWHTVHYLDAGRSSHRSYPTADGVCGGGPSNEHAYSTGLMLHYLLTGETASREAAVGLAEWMLRMDDGERTPLRLVSRGATGRASSTFSPEYHGPGRGAGNAIVVLLNGYRLTGRAAFLDKAEALIRRCIHPQDDLNARGLSDPESRWSYTVFLQALGRYLGEKIVRGEVDEHYTYARESLLHYARWMAVNEYPYLEKPAVLEFPTETWAAQDMRKSEVFAYAARHAAGDERDRFSERAVMFFGESLRMLGERPTRFLARPRVILLTCGFMLTAFVCRGGAWTSPDGNTGVDFGSPATFVPQKAAVTQLVKSVAVAVLLGVAAILVLVVTAAAAR